MEHVSKAVLLEDIQKSYDDFEQLLSSMTDERMATSFGNESWTVKDHLAHLVVWQQRSLNLLHAVQDDQELPDPTPNMSITEINEMFYQRYITLPLHSILADLGITQKNIINAVQALSEEDLNKPISWLNDQPVVAYVIGNTYEHYHEHTHYIQTLLKQTK